MPKRQLGAVIAYLHRAVKPVDEDGQLLERFVLHRDEAAFAALVRQYGPLVYSVCRRILPSEHDAEDAFQATFLVLARKSGSISKRESLKSWLHGVARRVALRAKAGSTRQRPVEDRDPASTTADPAEEAVWRDVRTVLDEEIGRLPEKYRTPFLLCYLEGKTFEETAREMQCPLGTVATRLARARERLGKRLTCRRLAFSAAALAMHLAQNAALEAAPPPLVSATIQTARLMADSPLLDAGNVSASVLSLTNGVLKTMMWNRFKWMVAIWLVIGLVGSGATALTYRALAEEKKEAVPKEATFNNAKLIKLLKERLASAKEEWDARMIEFEKGRGTLDFTLGASRRLLVAQQDVGTTRADRIAALEGHARRTNDIYKINKERFDAGRIPIQDLAMSNYYRLDAQIILERAKNADK